MTGRRQLEAYIRDHRDPASLPVARFTVAENPRKVACVLCGRDGYGPLAYDPERTYPTRDVAVHRKLLTFVGNALVQIEGPDTAPPAPVPISWWHQYSLWQIGCLMDHTWPCSCGRRFTAYATLWRHIGGERPTGWGRQGEQHYERAEAWPLEEAAA